MNLERFKDVNFVIDHANDRFITRQFVSNGDYLGRTLTVQITNNGLVGPLIGASLTLHWKNESSGLTDDSAFILVNQDESIYKIEYPQHMMTPGKVRASVLITFDGKTTATREFDILVQELAGTSSGVLEKSEFSALVAILSEANKWETRLTTIENNKVDSEKFTQELNEKADKTETDQLRQQKADQSFVDAQFAAIVSGAPKGTFTTKGDLEAKYPSGAEGVFLVLSDGNWYYWESESKSWKSGGVYQSSVLSDGQVTNRFIADGAVNGQKITSGAIESRHLTSEAVSISQINKNARGNNINKGIFFPMKEMDIVGNANPNPTANSSHLNSIMSVSVIGAEKNKVYAIAQILNGYSIDGTPRYGVIFSSFDINQSGTVDASSVKILNSANELDDKHPQSNIVGKTYFIENKVFIITYDTSFIPNNRLVFTSSGTGNLSSFNIVIDPQTYVYQLKKDFKYSWVAVGDSLTAITPKALKTYVGFVQDKLNINQVTNSGISGSTLNKAYDCMVERFLESEAADYMTIFGGMNDYIRNQPLGETTDTTTETTLGALTVLFSQMRAKFPRSKIAFILPHKIGHSVYPEVNSQGLKQIDYIEAIEKKCLEYGVPFLSLYKVSGLDMTISEQVGVFCDKDQVHLNNDGHEYIARTIAHFIQGI